MILNEIVNYLIFRDFIIPLVIIICCLIGCLIIYVKDKIKSRKKKNK